MSVPYDRAILFLKGEVFVIEMVAQSFDRKARRPVAAALTQDCKRSVHGRVVQTSLRDGNLAREQHSASLSDVIRATEGV